MYVSGSFSFNKGPVREVDVRTNLNQTQALPVLGALMAAGGIGDRSWSGDDCGEGGRIDDLEFASAND